MKGKKMKIITISREFGSGGREMGKRLADTLGFDYYDKEIIREIAANKGMNEDYVRQVLEEGRWQSLPLTYNRSFSSVTMQSLQIDILLEQKHVIEEIAKVGKNCLIVGRNADVLLEEYQPFTIFVCADMQSKIRRCIERAPEGEDLSPKELKRKICRMDKNRAQTRSIITGREWGERSAYHLTVNTASWDMKDLTGAVAAFSESWFERSK